ncbi:MAG: cytochrome c1 [Candidatus Azotimanducaceae bacterium]|jgi:cytochrome c1
MSGYLKKLVFVVFVISAAPLWAATEIGYDMESISPDLEDNPSLQNGMRLYMNYCLGCHSLQYQRYERTVDDFGIPHDIALEKLVFTGQKIGGLMTNAMPKDKAKNWFGATPPDLTMITRFKSPEYVYNYLKTFYVDESRPFGSNNKVFPNVGMPNVLIDLQGIQRNGCMQMSKIAANGGEMRDPLVAGQSVTEEKCDQLYIEEGTGKYTAEEFDAAVYDLTNFLYYVGEPSRLERQRTGIFVLLFLVILGCFTYLLNREYWKDVH